MRKLIYIIIAFIAATAISAQNTAGTAGRTTIKATWDSANNILLMGQVMPLHVEIVQDRDVKGSLLTANVDTLRSQDGLVELWATSRPDTVDLGNNRIQINQSLMVQSFDSGLYKLPPIIYLVDGDTLLSNQLTLKVVPMKVDTAGAIADYKPVLGVKRKWTDRIPDFITRYWWVWPLLVLLGVAIAYAIKYWRRYREQGVKPWQKVRHRLPPYEEAVETLNVIEKRQLWQNGQLKTYFTGVTDALRTYIDRRFNVPAGEMTTSQLMDAVREIKDIDNETATLLSHTLDDADLVKFADDKPDEHTCRRALDDARRFLDATRPKPEPAEDATADAPKPTTDRKEADS